MSEEQTPQENPLQNQSTTPFTPPNSGGFSNHGNMPFGMQMPLPNSTIVLVLGILSILGCCCYGVIGIIFAIIAIVLSNKDRALFKANPNAYSLSSFKNTNAGRICAIIGLSISLVYFIICAIFIYIYGFAMLNDQEAMREILEGLN